MTPRRLQLSPQVLIDWHQTRAELVPQWSRRIPTSVNDTYGDPFIVEQVGNTAAKLDALYDHETAIAIFTKAGPDPEVYRRLRDIKNVDQVVVFYSLTALDEGGISFDERISMINELKEIFPHVLVFTRPIIAGRNDDRETLARLVSVAASAGTQLVLGGLHDRYKQKNIEFTVEEELIELCDEAGVPCFHKTGCAAAYLYDVPCWIHDLGTPQNLDLATTFYPTLSSSDDVLHLPLGSTGDINFLRMLTRAEVRIQDLFSNYNLLTMSTGNIKLESTSSWFAWSENIEVCLDCDYCIIKQIEYLKKERVQIGVHPSRLLEVVDKTDAPPDFQGFRMTKLKRGQDADQRHGYADVRVVKPCFARRYGAPEGDA